MTEVPTGDRLRLLYELGCDFAARLELDELIPLVIRKCRDALDASAASVLLLDPETNTLFFPYVAEQNPEAAARLAALRVPVDRSIAGSVLRGGTAIRIDDVSADPRFYSEADRRTGIPTRALICAPLPTRQGTIGVIQVLNPHRGGPFSDDDLAFVEALAGSIAVAIENARLYAQLKQQLVALQEASRDREQLLAIRRELDIAHGIQQSILPRVFPRRTDFDIFAQMIPAREVGGDFYDFFFIDDTRLGVVIGDVSGKGVPAALFMAVSRSLLRSVALAGTGPAECLDRVNRLLCLENSADLFVTVFYGMLETRTGALVYSNGGHNPPYVVRGTGDVHALEGTGGTVLGIFDDIQFQAKRVTLRPGDGVFLFTDGVTEAMDTEGNLFSDFRLQAVLAERGRASSSEAVTRAVVDEVRRYSASAPQSDDIATMAIWYHGPANARIAEAITLRNDLAELERLGRVVDDFGRAAGLSAPVIFDLQLAANEIVTNVIVHGYDDQDTHAIVVRLEADDGEVRVEIEDDGRPFDPSSAPTPRLDQPLEERPLGGLGVHFARQVTDALEYRRQNERNILRMRKKTA